MLENANVWLNVSLVKLTFINNELETLTLGTSPLKLGCSHDSIGVDITEMPGR